LCVWVARRSWDGLHGSDGVQLVPTVGGVEDVRAPDQVALAELRLKKGAGISAAGLNSVRLGYLVLANGFEDEVALLTGDVFLIEEGYKLLVEVKADMEVAVGFLANLVHGACDRSARVQDLEPSGIVDVLPEVLITLRDGSLRG